MKSSIELERRRGGQIQSATPVARLAAKFGIGYRQMAAETGISYAIIKRLGSGKYPMTTERARRIARRYDVSTEFVLGVEPGGVEENGAWRLAGLTWEQWKLSGEPAGVTEEVGLNPEERNVALLAALDDCAKVIYFQLPVGREDRLALAYVCTWVAPRKYLDEELKRMTPRMKKALSLSAEMGRSWNNASPVVRSKQVGTLRQHFANAFFNHLPVRKVKAHTSLMRQLDDLARDAREHPQAPLIRKDIIKALVEIRDKYRIKQH